MINPKLFHLLEKRFGQDHVNVIQEDESMIADYKEDIAPDSVKVDKEKPASPSKTRTTLYPDDPGEEYRVNCPFCNDTRNRLYINHRWGVGDKKTGTINLWLANCWNERCLSDYGYQCQLYEQVYGSTQIGPGAMQEIQSSGRSSTRLKVAKLPGPLWPLDKMAKKSPNHEAIRYLESRLVDPEYIGRRFEVGYCLDSSDVRIIGRLVAPIRWGGKLIGWQARTVGDPHDRQIPKWLTCPRMRVGSLFYNGERALRHQTKVIVEGPPDVWGFGPQAMGAFRNGLSSAQLQLLVSAFEPGDVVVILLDPKQNEKEAANGRTHHTKKLFTTMRNISKLHGRILPVYLPGGCDPGEMDREYMRDLIRMHADEAGLPVSFAPPGRTNGKFDLSS